jgi:predicted AAA+ superfamily ATPase
MYSRYLNLSTLLARKSVFLLGPRQTGKSTYLRDRFPDALYINLLKNSEFQKYFSTPQSLREEVRYFAEKNAGQTVIPVIIDEIQKIPSLLDEVHDLIEGNKSLRFILTGSSARKLKRGGANLLGGRASWMQFHPLCFPELGDDNPYQKWMKRLTIGALPSVIDSQAPLLDLKDYVGLYLREEIQAEGLSRSIQGFARFLDFVGLMNTELVNYSAIGNDAQIPPSTARDYVQILSDTLIGHTLPAFRETKKRKAISTSKFYLFDCGVANALVGRSEIVIGTPEFGKALEHAIYLELRTYLDYHQSEKKLEYWRSTSQFEVDFLIHSRADDCIGIEVKATAQPSSSDLKGLRALEEDIPLKKKILVCNASLPRKTEDGIEILPIQTFLTDLWKGEILNS